MRFSNLYAFNKPRLVDKISQYYINTYQLF